MKTALITGIRGQDGAYLSQVLLDNGYNVIGTDRRSGEATYWRLKKLNVFDKIKIEYMDLNDFHNICDVIKKYSPDEIYNLAAQSFVQTSFIQPFTTINVNMIGVVNLLEAIRFYSPNTKFYQAGTCLPAGTSILIKKEIKRNHKGKKKHTYKGLGTENIENLKVGDCVLSMNIETSKKEYCKIVSISNRISNEMYTVYFENGNSLRLTGNHPVYIINKGWVRTDNLCIGDESIHKCCNSLENRKRKGKTNNIIYGEEKAKEISKKSSIAQKGKECSNGLKNKKYTDVFSLDKIKSIYEKRKFTWGLTEHVPWNKGLTKENNNVLRENGKKISKKLLNLWKDQKFANKVLLAQKKTISKSEEIFLNFLEELLPNEFLYNGLANHIVIGGKIPDFVNLNKKKIIEYNGNYWHTKEEAEERKKIFRNCGWETLFVWSDEFKNELNLVKHKIKNFAFNPNIELSRIVSIKKENSEKVYNIEVEKNHNFFANCVLVHNSEMFGKVQEIPQTETTPFYPRSPYGVAKLGAYWMTVNYRESYKIFACNGILFNHESPLRGNEFVTKKVVNNVCDIISGKKDILEVGNVFSKRDWGHAKDYCKAMFLMMQKETPQDYVISTGKTYSIKELIEFCFNYFNVQLEWDTLKKIAYDKSTKKILVKSNEEFYRPAEVDILIGDSSKARKELKWEPEYNFYTLINEMIEDRIKE